MIQFLSLVLSFIFLFFAGSIRSAEPGDCCGREGTNSCCQQEAEKETVSEKTPYCCTPEAAKENTSENAPDCCSQENRETESCCQEESHEKSLPDNIPDCCGT